MKCSNLKDLINHTTQKFVADQFNLSTFAVRRIREGSKQGPSIPTSTIHAALSLFQKTKIAKKKETKKRAKEKREEKEQYALDNELYLWSVLDIETASNGDLLDVHLYTPLASSPHQTFQQWDELESFLAVNNNDEMYRTILAHNGGGFDYPPFFLSLYEKVDFLQMAMSGSNIVFATLQDKKKFPKKVKFYDTLKVFNMSLDKACKAFKVKTPKQEITQEDYACMEKFRKDNPSKYYSYLKTDCISLHQCCVAVCKILEQTTFPVTAGQMALQEFMKFSQDDMQKCASYNDFLKWNKLFKKDFPDIEGVVLDEFIEKAMIGGRVEVFRRGEFPVVSSFDIVSLYPSAYRNMKVPTGMPNFTKKYRGKDCIGFYEIEFNQKNRNVAPIIPTKSEGLFFKYEGRQVVSHHEIELFKKYGSKDSSMHIIRGIYWNKDAFVQPFINFTDKFFELKSQGGGMKAFAKLGLNSLYGKFNQKGGAESLVKVTIEEILKNPEAYRTFSPGTQDFYVHISDDIPKHRKNYISALITATTRSIMYPYIFDNAERLLYMDTDSIHIFGLPHTFQGEVTHTKELGKMEQETPDSGVSAIYLMRKGYMKGDTVKMKGFANKCNLGGDSLTYDHYQKMLDGDSVEVVFNVFPRTKSIMKGKAKACKIEQKTKLLKAHDKYCTNWVKKNYIEGERRVIEPTERVFNVQMDSYC